MNSFSIFYYAKTNINFIKQKDEIYSVSHNVSYDSKSKCVDSKLFLDISQDNIETSCKYAIIPEYGIITAKKEQIIDFSILFLSKGNFNITIDICVFPVNIFLQEQLLVPMCLRFFNPDRMVKFINYFRSISKTRIELFSEFLKPNQNHLKSQISDFSYQHENTIQSVYKREATLLKQKSSLKEDWEFENEFIKQVIRNVNPKLIIDFFKENICKQKICDFIYKHKDLVIDKLLQINQITIDAEDVSQASVEIKENDVEIKRILFETQKMSCIRKTISIVNNNQSQINYKIHLLKSIFQECDLKDETNIDEIHSQQNNSTDLSILRKDKSLSSRISETLMNDSHNDTKLMKPTINYKFKSENGQIYSKNIKMKKLIDNIFVKYPKQNFVFSIFPMSGEVPPNSSIEIDLFCFVKNKKKLRDKLIIGNLLIKQMWKILKPLRLISKSKLNFIF